MQNKNISKVFCVEWDIKGGGGWEQDPFAMVGISVFGKSVKRYIKWYFHLVSSKYLRKPNFYAFCRGLCKTHMCI